jgi:hypothetical protein
MKTIAKYLTGLVTVMFVAQANADFMIEPFLGYEWGDYKSGSTKEDVTGTEMGLRLGGTFTMLSYGVEYAIGSFEVDSTPTRDVDSTDMGLFVGFEFPILVRAYATYFIKSESEVGSSEYEGNGLRLGVGYTGLPFVSINLEKISRTYDEDQNGALANDVKVETMMLSVSVPLP